MVFVKSSMEKVYGHEIHVHVILDLSKKNKNLRCIFKEQSNEKLSEEEIQALQEKVDSAGYFILLSLQPLEKDQILPSYYTRQAIEQVFGFAKSNTNILPLRVHDDQSIRGYLMLVFLALVIYISLRQRLQCPVDKALLTLRSFKAKVFDSKILLQEPNKKTKDLFNQLSIIMPTKLGI